MASRRLKITYDKNDSEIVIMGNKEGLEFLTGCIKKVIEKGESKSEHKHYHLQWQMNNLDAGSVETELVFSDDAEDYESS